MQPFTLKRLTIQVLTIARCDRWLAYHRLQELSIPCHCNPTGHLEVEVNSPLALLQLRSVLQQLTAPRKYLVDWLESCWRIDE
jgi:hypothetical protein